MNLPIYLDYAATTPVDPRVVEKMLRYLTFNGTFANAGSTHHYGHQAKEAVEFARTQVAELIGAQPTEIIWTSGATEANNLALKGAAELYQANGKHIVTLKTEHPSVLDCCQQLEKQGFSVTYLTPEKNGFLDLEKFSAALRPDTILVSIMHVNNELGIIQDISAIAKITAERGILLHVDAVQSAGKLPLNVSEIPIDLLSLSAHKLYGPKGIGALYIRRKPRIRVAAQIHGGGQENGMRSGTLPVHQIVAMGEACSLAKINRQSDQEKIAALSDHFWQALSQIKNIFTNTDQRYAIPNILNVRFTGIKAKELMEKLPALAFSAGSACHAKGIEPSYVLRALGQTKEEAECGVRFSFGKETSLTEINEAVTQIKKIF